MASKKIINYINIDIQKKFYLTEGHISKPQKKGSALATLDKIERVLREKKSYGDLTISREKLWGKLYTEATAIRDNYAQKVAQISPIKRFFLGLTHQEKVVADTYDRIENLVYPQSLFEKLPAELTGRIGDFLPTKDLGALATVNKDGKDHAKWKLDQRAKEYNAKGNFEKTNDYLSFLFQGIKTLVEDGNIPHKYIVYCEDSGSIDPEATFRKIRHVDSEKKTILQALFSETLVKYVKEGDVQAVTALIDLGADIEFRVSNDFTPLLFALQQNHIDIAKLLITKGADLNASSKKGTTPLAMAILYAKSDVKSYEICNFILKSGGIESINQRSFQGKNPLHLAAEKGLILTTRLLISRDADKEARDSYGWTPLLLALDKSQEDAAVTLINRGADVNASTPNGSTPLVFALLSNISYERIKFILDKGGRKSINQLSSGGRTALHIAASKEFRSIVYLLLRYGADRSLLNLEGKTARELTRSPKIKKILLDRRK